jgi:hypothetical protein
VKRCFGAGISMSVDDLAAAGNVAVLGNLSLDAFKHGLRGYHTDAVLAQPKGVGTGMLAEYFRAHKG